MSLSNKITTKNGSVLSFTQIPKDNNDDSLPGQVVFFLRSGDWKDCLPMLEIYHAGIYVDLTVTEKQGFATAKMVGLLTYNQTVDKNQYYSKKAATVDKIKGLYESFSKPISQCFNDDIMFSIRKINGVPESTAIVSGILEGKDFAEAALKAYLAEWKKPQNLINLFKDSSNESYQYNETKSRVSFFNLNPGFMSKLEHWEYVKVLSGN